MSVSTRPAPGRVVSWEEYERRGEDPLTEYIDGRLVMSPSPTYQHQQVCRRLANALDAVVPDDVRVVNAWSWKPGDDEFIPDVMVVPAPTETTRFTGVPALVVEVLSTNRSDDLVLKVGRYAAAGLQHYWIVDPRDGSLDAFVLDAGLYRHVAHLGSQDAPAVLDLGVATVEVDLAALLRD